MRDHDATNIVSKAFRQADRHTVGLMTEQMNDAVHEFLQAWKRRDDARRAHADIPELAAARVDLDQARAAMYRTFDA